MDDFGINEMLEMQKTLQEKYKDNFGHKKMIRYDIPGNPTKRCFSCPEGAFYNID